MKITLRSWPMIWLQYFNLLPAIFCVIFKWYLHEQLALTVKLENGVKGELSTQSPQLIFWWFLNTFYIPHPSPIITLTTLTTSTNFLYHICKQWYRLFSILTRTDQCKTKNLPHISGTTLKFDIQLLYFSRSQNEN